MRRAHFFLAGVFLILNFVVFSVKLPKSLATGVDCNVVVGISVDECDSLVALYTTTNGTNWANNDGWLLTNTPCSWFGITCNANGIYELNLEINGLTGYLPPELGNLPNLETLHLNDNQIGGNIPAELGNLSNLQELTLQANQLSGNIPSSISNLTNLQILYLSGNQLSGNIPWQIGGLNSLQVLYLSFNQLNGTIPSQLSNLQNLILLDLGFNQLSGQIPTQLGALNSLEVLDLKMNQLSGGIPSELSNLENLQILGLGGNLLTGSIPPQLGELANLVALDLGYNQLNGNIPIEFGLLSNLNDLYLNNNQLDGALPISLKGLSLNLFWFHETNLCEPEYESFRNWLNNIPNLIRTNILCPPKPVVILVHGFQGLTQTDLRCNPLNLWQENVEVTQWGEIVTDTGRLDTVNYWAEMPGWLDDDYDVWIAQLQTGSQQGTRSLVENGECLRNQIQYVYGESTPVQKQQKIIIIAHSMGGLVSRTCLSFNECRERVDQLITLGSPHAGMPLGGMDFILHIACELKDQQGVCDMSEAAMGKIFGFNWNHPNIHNIDYYFIGGDGSSGPLHPYQRKFYLLGAGPNDALVGKYSAVGWDWPSDWFVPWFWEDQSPPEQYWTDEFHSTYFSFEGITQIRDDYYHYRRGEAGQRSNSYYCITALLQNNSYHPTCSDVQSSTRKPSIPLVSSQFTQVLEGNLELGQILSPTLQVDTDSETIFYLSWYTGTVDLRLKRPDGQIIDPAYAASHPSEVTYGSGVGGPETPPFATYSFTNTLPGMWTLIVDANNLGAPNTDFWAFGLLETDRALTAGIDGYYFNQGGTAVLTATLQSSVGGISGANVTAEFARSDGITDTVMLIDQGGGNYSATYTIPNAPGYLSIAIVAAGNDNGTIFSRQTDLLAAITPQDAQFTETYSDQGNDNNGDGVYEKLNFNTEVDVLNAGDYIVSALLLSEDGQLITHVAEDTSLLTGTYTITLPFNGDDIRNAQIDGPYNVASLQITEISSGIPSQIVEEAWTTAAYSWSDFGTCKTLSLSVNPPSSGNITMQPVQNCNSGAQFITGTTITLTANANSGYEFFDWSGGLIGSDNPIFITINSDLVITANFTVSLPTITPTPTPSETPAPTETPTPSPTPIVSDNKVYLPVILK